MSPMRVVMNAFFAAAAALGLFDPKTDQQIGREPDQFPANEKQQQTVRDDDAEHRRGEKREVSEEAGEVFVVGHVADAENENPERDERDHQQHRGRRADRARNRARSVCSPKVNQVKL